MNLSGAKIAVKILEEQKIKHVFGIPGTHNIEFYDALIDSENITPVLITDEQSSGFLADGYARSSGDLAALSLVPGAGLTHAMSGIAEAFLDQIPLVVLLCGIRTDSKYSFQLHDVDQEAIVKPISKAVFHPHTHQELVENLREACHLAKKSPHGPTVVIIPANIMMFPGEANLEVSSKSADTIFKPAITEIEKAAKILNQSKSIGLYLGLGARGASENLKDLAEKLDAIVCTTISGKGVFSEESPRWVWPGLGRTQPAELNKVWEEVDCVLAIGCRFGEVATGSYGYSEKAKLIHVDIDPKAFSKNIKSELSIQSDANEFVQAILPKISRREVIALRLENLRHAQQSILKQTLDWEKAKSSPGVSPGLLLRTLQRICGPESVFVTDSGNGTFLAMEHLRLTKPGSFLAPVDYSCMGYSVPAGIGAKLAESKRPVIVLPGDGAFMMTGLEISTAASYGVGAMFFLLRDGELSQIAQFQKAALARETCTQVHNYQSKHIAAAVSAEFLELHDDIQVESCIQKALAVSRTNKPVLIEVKIDYSRPTYFSNGVVKTNFLRLGWPDRLRMAGRVIGRKILHASGLGK